MERKVIVAREAGFCRGVRRAVTLSEETLEKEKGRLLYSLGPLIHNPSVIGKLSDKGMRLLDSEFTDGELQALPKDSIILIRAHGIGKERRAALNACGREILDGTCPHVIAIQRIIEKAAADGDAVVILGDKGHAEVTGLLSYAKEGVVISSKEEVKELAPKGKLTVVSQSTLDSSTFEEVKAEILKRFPEAKIHNTRCDATEKRQREALELCSECEAMVVIGGKNSANSNRLAKICAEARPTFFVTDPENWDASELSNYQSIGVTAGASTPQSDIDLIVEKLRKLG
jgi:4-hydroxy-3-methylbut-2-enyl diphosphate reductase